MSKETKGKKVIRTPMLEHCKINKRILAALDRFVQMRIYMALAGKPCPAHIRLFRADYLDVDSAVRAQSDGNFNASQVTFAGVPLLPHDEPAKPFALEAA